MFGRDRLVLSVGDLIRLGSARLDTVILSGCDTALPSRQAPDESLGLPGVFLSAGVRRVVASMWPVDDLATFILMAETYLAYLVGTGNLSSALRTGARRLRHGALSDQVAAALPSSARRRVAQGEFEHPLAWAAFALYGSR